MLHKYNTSRRRGAASVVTRKRVHRYTLIDGGRPGRAIRSQRQDSEPEQHRAVAKADPAAIVNQDDLFFRREKPSAKMPIEARASGAGSETVDGTTSPSRTAHTASKFSTAIVC